ncbi:hypothetical protein GCM10010873_05480 [Cypionkella aquatica]|uniref:Uncharacterized protein n=1 Tax=Cypionkella aquatica TaxID=1756042 RepID=A0AA37TTM4_9RHOB|nr:hypothetical protein [Cypionkella aquatica]GLS85575.1 hypothetical protein GCM10010873_05480 [Cypionkella aquatica]
MENEYPEFQRLVNDSPFLSEKWAAMVERVQDDAMKHYGVQISESDVFQLSEARLGTFGGAFDQAAYEKEFMELKAFREVQNLRRVQAGDVVAQAEAVLKVEEIHPHKRAERMAMARKLGVASVGGGTKEHPLADMGKKQQLEILLTLPLAARIAEARKVGIME